MSDVDLGVQTVALILAAGLVSGAAGIWFFGRTTDAAKMRAAVNGVVAHLLEFRLFSDEPSLILKAQRDLLAANGRLLRCLAIPMLIWLVPLAGLVAALEGIAGRAPLPVGQATLVTMQLRNAQDFAYAQIHLDAPRGFRVETLPVRSSVDAQVTWRVRAVAAAAGRLQIRYNGRLLTKTISSTFGSGPLSEFRAGTLTSFLLHPLEPPFSVAPIQWIRVEYPLATVLHVHWLIWFTLASLAGGFLALLRN